MIYNKKNGNNEIENPKSPLVSVITVVRNDRERIQQCIDSVQNQLYSNIEHVIIDGASTDGTLDILKQNDDKIAFWLSEPDKGIYEAMNKAISYIHGDWILFLGSDDTLLPGFSEMANHLSDKRTIYYGKVIYKGEVYGGEYNVDTLAHISICHQAIMYPSFVFDKYRYDSKYKVFADHVLNLQCWKDPEIRFEYYDIVISDFNDTGVSNTTTDHLFFKNKNSLLQQYLGKDAYYRYRWTLLKEKIKRKINKRIKRINKCLAANSQDDEDRV